MSYHHLNTFERTRIEKMGYSTRNITGKLNCHHSTIARKQKQDTQKTYQVELADELKQQRHFACHRSEKKTEQVIEII